MVSGFIQRNKVILIIAVLVVIVGLSITFKMPLTDAQKFNEFQKNLTTINAPLSVGVKKFKASYEMTLKTYGMRTVYVDALGLNLAAQSAMKKIHTDLQVPSFKNQTAQAAVQNAHDLDVVYIKSLEAISKNVIILAQNSGFFAKVPPLTLPSTDKVMENMNAAYAALVKKPVKS